MNLFKNSAGFSSSQPISTRKSKDNPESFDHKSVGLED